MRNGRRRGGLFGLLRLAPVMVGGFVAALMIGGAATGALLTSSEASTDTPPASSTDVTTDTPAEDDAPLADAAAAADLTITKLATPEAVVGGEVDYLVTVQNAGTDPAAGVVIQDALPDGVTFREITDVTPESAECSFGSDAVLCDVGDLAAGATASFRVATEASAEGTIVNTAAVRWAGVEVPKTASDSTVVGPAGPVDEIVDLALDKSAPATAVTGSPFAYTLRVDNNGNTDVDDVAVEDDLPDGVTFAGSDDDCESVEDIVTCNVGTVLADDSVTVSFSVTASTGEKTNTATVDATGDANPEDNGDSATTTVSEAPQRESAASLAAAITSTPGIVSNAAYAEIPPDGVPVATSSSATAGFPRAGSTYAILSSGTAGITGAQSDLASADLGGELFRGALDVTVLRIDVNVPVGRNCLSFDFRFLSEEFPEFINQGVNDAFVAELDALSWSGSGNGIDAPGNFAFDASHAVISVNTAGMTEANAAGTIYDGATPLLTASTPITAGQHSLYLSLFDQGDHILDSAVFLDNLVLGTAQEGACVPGATTVRAHASASPATVEAGNQVTYTIEVTNEGGAAASLETISAILPAEFDYVAGSTSGVTTQDPGAEGQMVEWDGPFTVPAGGSTSLTFKALAGGEPGTYFIEAGASGIGVAVVPSGPTGAVEVQEAPVESPITVETEAVPSQVGNTRVVRATVSQDGVPLGEVTVHFEIVSGPNAGTETDETTDAAGIATFTYQGTGGVGTDVVQASFIDDGGTTHTSNSVSVAWFTPTPPAPPAGGGGGGGGGGSTTTTTTTTSAPPLPPLPPPTNPQELNARVIMGQVLVNGQPFTGASLKVGDVVDTTRGTLELRSTTGNLLVYDGAFRYTLDGTVAQFELVGGDFSICQSARRAAGRAADERPVRRLWGKGTGSFKTKARYSSATVRGTTWLTEDRCDGTLIQSDEGTVEVYDYSLRRLLLVAAGNRYLAQAPPPPTPGSFVGDPTGTVLINGQPVTQDTQVRNGDTVDVRNGRLLLRTTSGEATFYSGRFIVTQPNSRTAFTLLRLVGGNFATACGANRRVAAVDKDKPKKAKRKKNTAVVRSLWGDGAGKFRTQARYSSATVRGTVWLTVDRCDGSLVRVVRGRVEVRDLTQRKTVFVNSGGQYLAPAPG